MFRVRFYCGGQDRAGKNVLPDVYKEVLKKAFHGFTMCYVEGNYMGQDEASYVFEILVGEAVAWSGEKVGKELARVGNQSEVLVTTEIVNSFFVGPGK